MLESVSRVRPTAWQAVFAAVVLFAAMFMGARADAMPAPRGYELVSPPDKNGGNALPQSNRTRAASEGDAATFASLSGFGDVHGTGIAAEYMSVRTAVPGTRGWATHGITPPQEPLSLFGAVTIAGEPAYEGEFAADLGRAVFRGWSPVTDDPDVANVQNLYLRTDVRTPGVGSFDLLTACPACLGTPLPYAPVRPFVADTSVDLEHVLFESPLNLTGAGGGVQAYVADGNGVRHVGAVPSAPDTRCGGGGPSCVVPAGSIAGVGASNGLETPRTMSDDGTRVFFASANSSGGIITGFPAGNRSKLYLHDSHGTATTSDDTTTQLNVSERIVPQQLRAALYETASNDGTRAFFTSQEALTDTLPSGTTPHLYMWDGERQNDAVQRVTVAATGGTFTLSFDGQVTTALPAGASASVVEAALDSLSTVGDVEGDVSVSGGPGDETGSRPYFVSFGGSLAESDVPLMVADGASLTGGNPASSATVTPWVRGGGHLTVIDQDHEGADAPGAAVGVVGASARGDYVYFVAVGQIVEGEEVLGGDRGLYLWHEGDVRFIGRFDTLSVDWLRNLNRVWSLEPRRARVTEDGKHLLLALTDSAGFGSYEHNGTQQFYLYDADADAVRCVSCNDGAPGGSASASVDVQKNKGAANPTSHMSNPMAQDGERVFFSSGEALVEEDANGKQDVYEYRAATDSVHLVTTGVSSSDSYFLDASASGDDVFFVTRERLVGWDVDSAYDLYDARVGGGFPDPVAPAPACAGSACQGPAPLTPAALVAGSSTFAGSGNARSQTRGSQQGRKKAKRCTKGRVRLKVRGRVRCVRRAKARRIKAQRARVREMRRAAGSARRKAR